MRILCLILRPLAWDNHSVKPKMHYKEIIWKVQLPLSTASVELML